MVVIRFPSIFETGVTHDRVASPSTCTVHIPHIDMPHPYFVPLRSRRSRSTHRSGMSAGASTVRARPFTENLNGMVSTPIWAGAFASARYAGRYVTPIAPDRPEEVEIVRGGSDLHPSKDRLFDRGASRPPLRSVPKGWHADTYGMKG